MQRRIKPEGNEMEDRDRMRQGTGEGTSGERTERGGRKRRMESRKMRTKEEAEVKV